MTIFGPRTLIVIKAEVALTVYPNDIRDYSSCPLNTSFIVGVCVGMGEDPKL